MKKIIIVSGDPNSINSEIIYKVWKKISKNIKKKIIFISNKKLLDQQFKKLKYKISTVSINGLSSINFDDSIKILDVKINFNDPFKVSRKSSSRFINESLDLAHKLAKNKEVIGIINCPIDKKNLNNEIGVTELLASKCKIKKDTEVMLIRNDYLSVSPITTHFNIKSISKKLSKSLIVKKILVINNSFKKYFKKTPKIALLGLNPHNAEFKKNSEEKKIILPAIRSLKKLKIFIKGPFASDTIFINEYKKYDVVVGMYHDQVISPFKTLFKYNAINLTLGLKYLRVSPDHGVASDKVLLKRSNPQSLFECIKFLNKFS